MRVDLWHWFNQFAAQAYLEGNPEKQWLIQLYDSGWEALRAEQHQTALEHFEAGLRLAQTLQLQCFDLFFDYWCCETLIFYKSDYRTGLDRAIRMGARAHQDAYQECPVRGRVYYTLMYVYYAMDAIGYEDKIREMIAFMARDIPLDDDTAQRMVYTQSSLAFTLENYDEARAIIEGYIDTTLGNAHRQSGGYNMLRMVAYAEGKIQDALRYALIGESFARNARLENSVAHSLLWQGLYAHYLGLEDKAQTLHQRGLDHYKQFDLKPLPDYYNAVCAYLERTGDAERALTLREEQLNAMSDIGSVSYIAYSHLQHVRLLGRMGKDITDALANAYKSSEALRKPKQFHDKLAKVEAGNYFQYDWQKTM